MYPSDKELMAIETTVDPATLVSLLKGFVGKPGVYVKAGYGVILVMKEEKNG
jgi:hypothetical protein